GIADGTVRMGVLPDRIPGGEQGPGESQHRRRPRPSADGLQRLSFQPDAAGAPGFSDGTLLKPHASPYQRIYRIVRRIPRGRVATYGQVALLAGLKGHARQVGYALHALPDAETVPWQRVINARGEI